MTGTLCVNKPVTVPVIFEPPFTFPARYEAPFTLLGYCTCDNDVEIVAGEMNLILMQVHCSGSRNLKHKIFSAS